MTSLSRELSFLFRHRASVWMLILLAALAALSVGLGLTEVARQNANISRVLELQKTETAAIKVFATEAGDAAYYRFHPTWDAPAALAFAALGQRDISPTLLRVRALAIEGQIYENDTQNPELVLPGRFDFAFVLIYLTPLVLIALLHDLWSSEREAGRLAALQAIPKAATRIWMPRIAVRIGLVSGALLIPFLIGALINRAPTLDTFLFAGLIILLVGFWALVSIIIATRNWASATNAAALATIWFVITLVVPAGANLAINAATPIPDGGAIMRENREAVHDAWDLDRAATLQRFYATHPQWAASPPMTKPFEWKWYFAFQQLGDDHVSALSQAYRDGIEKREAQAGLVGFMLPPIAIQRGLHRLANSDIQAQSAYQERIRDYHKRLRTFYYPFLFSGKRFTPRDYDNTPEFDEGKARTDKQSSK